MPLLTSLYPQHLINTPPMRRTSGGSAILVRDFGTHKKADVDFDRIRSLPDEESGELDHMDTLKRSLDDADNVSSWICLRSSRGPAGGIGLGPMIVDVGKFRIDRWYAMKSVAPPFINLLCDDTQILLYKHSQLHLTVFTSKASLKVSNHHKHHATSGSRNSLPLTNTFTLLEYGITIVGYREDENAWVSCLRSLQTRDYPINDIVVVVDGDEAPGPEMAHAFNDI
ncbi:hypothetical protein A0H81_11052 [Grifola frondosa]|uniref:Uncharacterized protein n=1 Tax=Grifola frondosa TaxID=5627 RepID=A0A1C7LWA3_GRIFR|nr:hypothetical protein A0H81_11052 [Grifola frondosa]